MIFGMNQTSDKLAEDLEFARRTEEAWREFDKGNFTRYSAEEFFKRLETTC